MSLDPPRPPPADLRTLVVRRVGPARRVALLATDQALVKELEQSGCSVLADPPSPEAVAAFRPEVVVAFDGLAQDGGAGFELVARAAPEAELLFSSANAASGTALLRALAGASSGPGLVEAQVRALLQRVGYVVLSRDVVVEGLTPTGLAADTEAALRGFFEQLNPDTAADRFLFLARPGQAPQTAAPVPGLVSVVVSSGDQLAALEGTLSALGRQALRPLEVLVASPLGDEALERPLERLRASSQLTVHAVAASAPDWAVRTNAGLALATGRRVAFLEAGDLLAPTHLARLARALDEGTAAWASVDPPPGAPTLARWLEHGVRRGAWLIDRDRLGAVPLTFAEGAPEAEALLFTRLALLFPPAGVPGESTLDAPGPPSRGLEEVLEATRLRPLRGLSTLEALLEVPSVTAALDHHLEALPAVATWPLRRALGVLRGVRGKR